MILSLDIFNKFVQNQDKKCSKLTIDAQLWLVGNLLHFHFYLEVSHQSIVMALSYISCSNIIKMQTRIFLKPSQRFSRYIITPISNLSKLCRRFSFFIQYLSTSLRNKYMVFRVDLPITIPNSFSILRVSQLNLSSTSLPQSFIVLPMSLSPL